MIETKNRVALAKVRLTLEFDCGAWGADCTIGQAVNQSKEDALRQLHGALKGNVLPFRLVAVEAVEVALVPEKTP